MVKSLPRRQRVFSVVAWSTLVFNMAVIIGGTIVRATGSGAGCGESWPKCGDQFVPPNDTVETLIEYSHRLSSVMAGIGVAAMFFLALWVFEKGHIVRKAATVSGFILVVEALLGAALVLFGWVEDDISVGRMVAVSLHLTNTFLLLGALTLTAWWGSGNNPPRIDVPRSTWKWILGGAIAIVVVGATGALNAIADAVFPADSVADGIAAEFGPTAPLLLRLRVLHPVIAVLGGLFAAYSTVRIADSTRSRWWSNAVVLIVFTQMFIGIANIVLLTPLAMQMLHLFVADVLWIAFVLFAATALERSDVPAEMAPST